MQISQILFRSRNRVGQLSPEDIPDSAQRHLELRGGTGDPAPSRGFLRTELQSLFHS
ncbi:hypothetical protein U5801_19830 [Lamprobacter modestohalophilus]|uniref:hypothetical protein n=1 Tax=Lamprobacter modestohalophilus TaxID=1064514 RepID=UPI002ADEF61E|nr:hypothetical protein [Lamprobacter modestohalophilus]MEA1052039.1 hypothetical protein [Lamprobacter modestohalophilus]